MYKWLIDITYSLHTQYCFFSCFYLFMFPTEALMFVFFFQTVVDPNGGGWSGPTKQPSVYFSPCSLVTLNLQCTSRQQQWERRWRRHLCEKPKIQLGWETERTRRKIVRTKRRQRKKVKVRIKSLRVARSWNPQSTWAPLLACCWSWCAAPCWAWFTLPAATRPAIKDTHIWETLIRSAAWGTTL